MSAVDDVAMLRSLLLRAMELIDMTNMPSSFRPAHDAWWTETNEAIVRTGAAGIAYPRKTVRVELEMDVPEPVANERVLGRLEAAAIARFDGRVRWSSIGTTDIERTH